MEFSMVPPLYENSQSRLSGQYQHPCGINLNTSGLEFYMAEGDVSREDDSESRPIYFASAVENRTRIILVEQIDSKSIYRKCQIETYRAAVKIISRQTCGKYYS